MPTLKLTIFKPKALADGRHKIRIAVCHKRVTCYIVTHFIIDSLSQFKNGRIVKRPDAAIMNTKLRNLLNEYQEKLDKIKHPGLYDCRQIKNLITDSAEEKKGCTFQSVCNDFITFLKKEERQSYATSMERNCRYFLEFLRGDICLSDITPTIIQNYANFIRKRKVSETTVNTLMAQTKAIINRAIREQRVSYTIHPFITTKISMPPVRKLDISVHNFNKIRLSSPSTKRLRMARDLFCLSFYLGGINLIDLMDIDFRKGRIEYTRKKTQSRMQGSPCVSISVPDEAKPIISNWMNKKNGKLDFGYKFTYHNFSQYVTYSITALAKELNINERVTYYSARKSFAQYASELGIPDSIIDYCLGHSDKSKGIIRYYTKVRSKQADMAISKIIDYVNNPEKYKAYLELRQDIMMMKM